MFPPYQCSQIANTQLNVMCVNSVVKVSHVKAIWANTCEHTLVNVPTHAVTVIKPFQGNTTSSIISTLIQVINPSPVMNAGNYTLEEVAWINTNKFMHTIQYNTVRINMERSASPSILLDMCIKVVKGLGMSCWFSCVRRDNILINVGRTVKNNTTHVVLIEEANSLLIRIYLLVYT